MKIHFRRPSAVGVVAMTNLTCICFMIVWVAYNRHSSYVGDRITDQILEFLISPLGQIPSRFGMPGADNSLVLLFWLTVTIVLNAYLWGAVALLLVKIMRRVVTVTGTGNNRSTAWVRFVLLGLLLSALAYIYFAYPKLKKWLIKDTPPPTRFTIKMLDSAIDGYMLDHSAKLPPSLQDLLPYLRKTKSIPKDSWGKDFIYTPNHDQGTYIIASPGPDGILGTADDITN